ncbi:MAG: hypothetical protein CMB97_16305 [Flavobacteriaceae bacterium]|nr:hypothetical protein [Flavobacteriaceae bacterium]|tara:strand:- start:2139 stop:2348 length:210 start_codon:yes stop_codon:yes gene_type:complete
MTLFTFQRLNLESGLYPLSSGNSASHSDDIFVRINIEQVGIWFSKLNRLKERCVSAKNHKLYINKNRLK